jgi:hypothetical protein
MMRRGLTIVMEENSSGVTESEIERTFYAVVPADYLASHSVYEDQEQWHCQLPSTAGGLKARIRVRKTSKSDGSVEYTQTLKIDQPGSVPGHSAVNETQLSVTENFFTEFKRVSSSGMIKRRVRIKSLDGQDLEVDAFLQPDGTYSTRVKIDNENSTGTPQLPPEFTDIVDGDTESKEEVVRIKSWYATIFLTKKS